MEDQTKEPIIRDSQKALDIVYSSLMAKCLLPLQAFIIQSISLVILLLLKVILKVFNSILPVILLVIVYPSIKIVSVLNAVVLCISDLVDLIKNKDLL